MPRDIKRLKLLGDRLKSILPNIHKGQGQILILRTHLHEIAFEVDIDRESIRGIHAPNTQHVSDKSVEWMEQLCNVIESSEHADEVRRWLIEQLPEIRRGILSYDLGL